MLDSVLRPPSSDKLAIGIEVEILVIFIRRRKRNLSDGDIILVNDKDALSQNHVPNDMFVAYHFVKNNRRAFAGSWRCECSSDT